MTDEERLERVKQVLDEALQLDTADRPVFLSKACVEEEEIREEIESLLGVASKDTKLHERPIFSLLKEDGIDHLEAGTRLGPFQIVRSLESGGMGTVALAERVEGFEQQVAIKVLHTRLISQDVVKRFQLERQILADLKHPNIVRILDAGKTEDERPFFVMEYIDGRNITTWLEQENPDLRTRIKIFYKICDAVYAAHQNLIVHRDIKPNNVLVDAKGEPKLLDFGIAKPIGPDLKTKLTQHGQSPMTLYSASPEQLEGRLVTTASDTYALGVLLFHILTRRLPYGEIDSHAALVDAICKTPPISPSQENPEIDPDLDAITLKALRKEPTERYNSVAQMQEDISRYLDGLPVLARQGSRRYVIKKFVRRHWKEVLAACAFVLVLMVSAVTSEILRQDAEKANRVTANTFDLAYSMVNNAVPGEKKEAREILDKAAKDLDNIKPDPVIAATLYDAIGDAYTKIGAREQAEEYLRRSVELSRHLPQRHLAFIRTLIDLGGILYSSGRTEEAKVLYLEALEVGESHRLERIQLAKAISPLGSIALREKEFAKAEEFYKEALRLRLTHYGPNDIDTAQSYRNLGNLLYVVDRAAEGEEYLRHTVRLWSTYYGEESTKVATALSTLGRILYEQGKWDEALETLQRCLEIRKKVNVQDSHRAATLRDLAEVHLAVQDIEKARLSLDEARTLTDENTSTLIKSQLDSTQGALWIAEGEYEKARELLAGSSRALAELRGNETIFARRARQRLARAEELLSD